MPSYREQYDRMKRWYDRFSNLNSGRPHDIPTENYVDEIYAFFLNAYHLKDWIKNDSAVLKAVQNSVEPHITNNTSLSLCADICNALKHLHLQTNRSNQNPE